MSVNEDQLLRELNKLQRPRHHSGRQGRAARAAARPRLPQFREGALPWIGGIAVLGMLARAGGILFLARPDPPRAQRGIGPKILRFNAFERFTHWMTATCFIVLATHGLNYIFGKRLLMPLIGPGPVRDVVAIGEIRAQLPVSGRS